MPHSSFECLGQNWRNRGKKKSFTKVIQSPKKALMDFLQLLTSAVNRMIPNSEARQITIQSLTFENANSLCKRIISSLKVRSTPLEEWTQKTVNIE